ncbi:MAG: serine hydrolase domain-containing protein, partial [Bacteroidota bacterium]
MHKVVFLLLAIISFISCKQQETFNEPSLLDMHRDSLSIKLNEIHKQGHINGFAVAIVNQKEVLYEAGIGSADIDTKESYTENTIQNIGSVSKTFIGVTLLKAQELGKLSLDDPINKYLPFQIYNPNHPKEAITLRHLATHTSTILDTDYYDEQSYILKEDIEVPDSIMALAENFKSPSSAMPLISYLEKLLSDQGEWY